MKFCKFLLLVFLCVGCQEQDLQQTKNQDPNELKDQLINDAIYATIQEMYKKHGLLIGATGASAPDKIKSLFTWYTYRGKPDIMQARILFVDAVEELAKQINQRTELVPFLCEVPFEKMRADVCIFFEDENGYPLKLGELSLVDRDKNGIRYRTEITQGKKVIIFRELFSEAVANIEKQKQLYEADKSSLKKIKLENFKKGNND